jgi:hypothetical protein
MEHIVVDRKGLLWDFLEDPERHGAVLTGSRAFGVETKYSDYDYIITNENYDKTGLYPYSTNDGSYEDSDVCVVKFKFKGTDIDLLKMSTDKAKSWSFATSVFEELVETNAKFRAVIKDKGYRVRIFSELVSVFDSFISKKNSYKGGKL